MRFIGVVVAVALFAGCVGEDLFDTTEQGVVSPPTNLRVTALTPFVVEMTWDAVPGVDNYVVQEAVVPGAFQDRTSIAASVTTFTDGVNSANQFKFRVKASVAGELSAPSNEVTVAPPTFMPPTNVAAVAPQPNGIHLSWTAAAFADKYYLYRALGAGSFSYLTTVTGTSYDDLGLSPNTQYRYRLTSGLVVKSNVESAPSNIAAATTPGTTPVIGPPSSVTATATSSSAIRVEWTAVSGSTKYYVFQAQGGGAFAYVGTALATSWDALGLAPSTSYSFVIEAVDVFDSASIDSSIATATTPSTGTSATPAPTIAATAVSSTRISVSWNSVAGAAKYYVFLSQGGAYAYVGTTYAISYDATSLTPSTEYSFVVQAVDFADVASADSTPSSATTFATDASTVAPPTSVQATATSSSRIEVTWSAVSGAAKYYVLASAGGGPATYAGTALSESFSLTNLTPSTTYSITIQSVDANGYASASSTPASATTPASGMTAVGAPSNVVATATSSSRIGVTWDPVVGAATYYVFQAQGAGSIVYVATVASASYTATNLAASTMYTYVIKAVDSANAASADSAPASATTLAIGAGGSSPTVTATTISTSRIELAWNAVSGAAKYYVFQAQGAGPLIYVGTIAVGTAYSATALPANTAFTFVVEAVDAANGVLSDSLPVSATTFDEGPLVSVPSTVTAQALSSTRIDPTWTSVSGAVKYYLFRQRALER